MFAALGWMFHASLASKMFLSLFFLFEMTREHQQLELEMFLQLLGTESLWSHGRFPEGVPEGGPHVISICSSSSAAGRLPAVQLPGMSCTRTHVYPIGFPTETRQKRGLRAHTEWAIVAKK